MLAKLTDQNQITLPLSVTQSLGSVEYFEITVEDGKIILTPVKVQRADAVRKRLAELNITEQDVAEAVAWAREDSAPKHD
ncbi:MAG TPA: AbrB/MazE/SpoVT family DNA-binding domain-containing protein [Leptolyngbyaceae cyanobacterium]